jgi:cytochrome c1
MNKTVKTGILLAGLAIAAALPAFAGGWAVVTLDQLPAGVVAGEPVNIGFTVRQHGQTPISDLDPLPSITATSLASGEVVRAVAQADTGPGHYSAQFVLPTAGEWTWGIRAFGDQLQPMPTMNAAPAGPAARSVGLPPAVGALLAAGLGVVGILLALRRRIALAAVTILLAVVAAAAVFTGPPSTPAAEAAAPITTQDEGQALFVAKGCVVCHVNNRVAESKEVSISIGPDLSLYRNDPTFLAGWLADPSSVRPATNMPRLDLSQTEIEALIAFLNGESKD